MKLSKISYLCFATLVLCSCNNRTNPSLSVSSEEPRLECEVTVRLNKTYSDDSSSGPDYYNLKFDYRDDFFDGDAKTFSKDLELLSFASSVAGSNQMTAKNFYDTLEFDNYIDRNYDKTEVDSIAYYIAHKTITNYDLISISIRGLGYQEEWANNFVIGEYGNHKGFDDSAEAIYQTLANYISTYYSGKNIKLWVSGYSRGGAVANVLASKILHEKEDISISEDDSFFYTFESPAAVSLDNAIEYQNIHNIINENDIVPMIPPIQYGLSRCGTDVVLSDTNIESAVEAFDQYLILPQFIGFTYNDLQTSVQKTVTNEKGFIDAVVNCLLREPTPSEEEGFIGMTTREEYYQNYETNLSYLVGFFFGLPKKTLDKVINKIKNIDASGFDALLSKDGFYNMLVPILFSDDIEYDSATLKAACETLRVFVNNNLTILNMFIDTKTGAIKNVAVDDALRIGYMHFPEVVYALMIQ